LLHYGKGGIDLFKKYKFKYGDQYLNIDLCEDDVLMELNAKMTEPPENLKEELMNLLDNPIDSKPFNEIFKSGDKVVIVVSDITRLWIQTARFLPFIIERLNHIGIKDEDIVILVANGTHRGQSAEELKKVVGENIFQRIEVVEHDCDRNLVYVGTTSLGTRVEVNRLVMERKVILTGGIVHHLMAGYGGGRKSILPGVAGRNTIAQNHLHALDYKNPRSNPLIGAGVTANNPLNLDMIEAANFVKPDFLVNSIVDTNGNIIKIVAGNWLTAWEEGCRYVDEIFGVPLNNKADLVIASCGGYPKDISLYQSTKALLNASLAVKPGGTILLLAECREGAGAREFFDWIAPLKEGKLDQELRKNFNIPGYIFYAAVEAAQKFNVILLSSIDSKLIEPMGIKAVTSLEKALEIVMKYKKSQKIIIMPFGGATIPIQRLNHNQ